MKKKPRFFCDNCGSEVEKNTKACPQCGRFFASVRCPSCGFSGEESLFTAGCPSCGYSSPASNASLKSDVRQEKKILAGPLQIWVYVIAVCAFIATVTLLFLKFIR